MKAPKTPAEVLCFVVFLVVNFKSSSCSDFYDISVKDILGKEIVMGDFFRDKVVLVVNVASKCGYTDLHYKQLVEIQSKFPLHDHFVILAFPCNQFGNQEPNRNSAIMRFAKNAYAVNFPIFSKIKVTGENAHPLYQFLERETQRTPTWNFNKYLIDRQGEVVKYWDHEVPPLDCLRKIEKTVNLALHNSGTIRVDDEL